LHIPDGYLSPSTCIVLAAACVPFWRTALGEVSRPENRHRQPLVALFAAASFVVMMFNLPLPGGTSGHATGAALAGIVLGPWLACLSISTALIIQALFFGDGGILAVGANCFNMAVVMPVLAHFIYKSLGGNTPAESRRRFWAAAFSGYVSLNVAAFLTALQFGIQPLFFKAADGTPLYAPYGLDIAIPAMMLGHLLVAGVAEGLFTALVLAYLLRGHRDLLEAFAAVPAASAGRIVWLWAGLAVLAFLTPLGLLASGTAWGEWGLDEIGKMLSGFVPAGMARLTDIWTAPVPDYAVPFLGETPGYVVSALAGAALISGFFWMLAKACRRG